MASEHRNYRLIPRWAMLVVWSAQLLLAHAGAPAGLAALTPRVGWRRERPGPWNLLGLILVVLGLVGQMWCVVLHFARSPRIVEAGTAAPPYLLTDGPYRWSRNPMYVAGMAMWAGWTIFYGSVAVLLGMLTCWSGVIFAAVPFEERRMEARFGDSYADYKRSVPRWLPTLGGARPR